MCFIDFMKNVNMKGNRKELMTSPLGGAVVFSISQKYNSFVKQG